MTGDVGPGDSLNVVERALRSSPGASGWREPVVVVPGGHRPGKPDFLQRDQARATLPLPGPARIVVLGCTAGAGQTITTLLLGQMLTSLRGEPVAVVDLSDGESSLTAQARSIPVLLPARRTGAGRPPGSAAGRGLQVVTAGSSDDDAGQVLNAVVARYPLTLADPGAASVPKAVRVADQLILVAPATAEAAGSLAMTMEWLEAHDHAGLAAAAIVVLNGVSPRTAPHADKAAAVASGRCRAIVRVPWDARLKTPAALGPATVQAVTALAGVVVAALADAGTVSTASGSVTT
jgi:MinD-like ATPase involved in chromosome partitioning or flagellar assembly